MRSLLALLHLRAPPPRECNEPRQRRAIGAELSECELGVDNHEVLYLVATTVCAVSFAHNVKCPS